MESQLTTPLNDDELQTISSSRSFAVYLGCISPASRFLCCCPLQVGVYTVAVIYMIVGMLDTLALISSCSSPWLIADPRADERTRHSFIGFGLRLIFGTTTIVFAFQIARFAWRAAGELDAILAKKAIKWVWIWTAVTATANGLPLVLLILAATILGSQQGGGQMGNNAGDNRGALVIFCLVLTFMVIMTVWPIVWGTLVNYYLWSFKERVLSGESVLVLMGTQHMPANADPPAIIVADASSRYRGPPGPDSLAATFV